MYSKSNRVYADTYKYLKHKEKNIIALSYMGSADDFYEVEMSLPITVSVVGNMIFWENNKLAIRPSKTDYNSIKEHIIKSRYSNDEQLAIILNKDKNEDGQYQYVRMQAWRDFAKEMAKIVDIEGYEAMTALSVAKEKKISEISVYDSSPNVNSFSIGSIDTWIDKATRVGLKLRFEAEKRLGKTETILWQNGMQFKLPLVGDVTAFDMLDGIELYASSCYDVTQMHLAAINTLTSVDEVNNYNYLVGYPEKLKFL